jgi:HEAT repeat protein/putative zinc finger protein
MTIHDTSDGATSQKCGEWQPLLMLFAAGGELEPAEQAQLAAHLSNCTSCCEALEREKELLSLLTAHRSEPDAALLASARASLDDVLDREEEHGWLRRALGLRLPLNWLSPRPAWSAAVLLIVGFAVGASVPRLLRHPVAHPTIVNPTAPDVSAGVVSPDNTGVASSSFAGFDLHSADVAGINVFPSGNDGPPRVQLQLKAQQPMTVEGTVDDDNVKGVLLNVLSSGERFCPDVRLDAVECLSSRSNDPEIRSALCRAVHKDRNPAVRLKALEALDGSGSQEMVRQTLLDALVDDQNPGVRIEAVNALREMAAKGQMDSDGRTVNVLRERVKKDPNTYIRLQSAAAVRDIGPREKF